MFKEYKPLEMPKGMSGGLIFSMASSRQLDIFGKRLGLKRRKFLFLKEPDFFYKIRIRNNDIRLKTNQQSDQIVNKFN